MPNQKYDAEEFLVPQWDFEGKARQIRCRVLPLTAELINEIFRSGKFPFRTPQDLIRWSIHRGLNELQGLEPVPSIEPLIEIMILVLRMNYQLEEFDEFFTALQRVVFGILSWGTVKEAKALLATVNHVILILPSGYWRAKYLTELRKQWGYLLIQSSAESERLRAPSSSGVTIP